MWRDQRPNLKHDLCIWSELHRSHITWHAVTGDIDAHRADKREEPIRREPLAPHAEEVTDGESRATNLDDPAGRHRPNLGDACGRSTADIGRNDERPAFGKELEVDTEVRTTAHAEIARGGGCLGRRAEACAAADPSRNDGGISAEGNCSEHRDHVLPPRSRGAFAR